MINTYASCPQGPPDTDCLLDAEVGQRSLVVPQPGRQLDSLRVTQEQ